MSLNHESIKNKLQSLGLLNNFLALKNEEKMLELDFKILQKMGFEANKDQALIIVYNKTQFDYYMVDFSSDNIIGYGEESSIHPGKNLKTQEEIALKTAHYGEYEYRGWKVAFEHLNNHPNFVKSYAIGEVYNIVQSKGGSFELKGSNICLSDCDRNFAYQIMERVQEARTLPWIQYTAKDWSVEQINAFMSKILNAYDTFINIGIVGFDDSASNILLDKNNNPKLCDFNPLKLSRDNTANRFYRSATNSLYYIFRAVRTNYFLKDKASKQAVEKIDARLDALRKWLEKTNDVSRATVEKQFQETVKGCVRERCLVTCFEGLVPESTDQASEESSVPVSTTTLPRMVLIDGKEIKERVDCSPSCDRYARPAKPMEANAEQTVVIEASTSNDAFTFMGFPIGANAEVLAPSLLGADYVVIDPVTLTGPINQNTMPKIESLNTYNTGKINNIGNTASTALLSQPPNNSTSNIFSTGAAIVTFGLYLYSLYSNRPAPSTVEPKDATNKEHSESSSTLLKDRSIFYYEISKIHKMLKEIWKNFNHLSDDGESYMEAYNFNTRNLKRLISNFEQGKATLRNLNSIKKDVQHLRHEVNEELKDLGQRKKSAISKY